MLYYTCPVQLNQKEMKRGLITICQYCRLHRSENYDAIQKLPKIQR